MLGEKGFVALVLPLGSYNQPLSVTATPISEQCITNIDLEALVLSIG